MSTTVISSRIPLQDETSRQSLEIKRLGTTFPGFYDKSREFVYKISNNITLSIFLNDNLTGGNHYFCVEIALKSSKHSGPGVESRVHTNF